MGWKEFTDNQVTWRCSDIYTAPFCFGGLSFLFSKQVSQAKYIWTDKYNVLFYICACINFFWKHNIQVLNIWTGRCNALFYTMALSPFFWKHNLQVLEIWTDTYNALLYIQALSILFPNTTFKRYTPEPRDIMFYFISGLYQLSFQNKSNTESYLR